MSVFPQASAFSNDKYFLICFKCINFVIGSTRSFEFVFLKGSTVLKIIPSNSMAIDPIFRKYF